MGHGGMSKRHPDTMSSSSTTHDDELDNSISQFPRPPSGLPSSLSVVASAAQLSDLGLLGRRRHRPGLGPLLFPPPPSAAAYRPSAATSSSANSENPQFPLISAGDDRVGGRALLREFLTFLDLKGANSAFFSFAVRTLF